MRTWLAFLVSVSILAVIFLRIDLGAFRAHLAGINPILGAAAVLFFAPQIAISAYRWRLMVQGYAPVGLGEASQLILAGNALNILLPSRVGDLSKAYFAARQGKMDLNRGMNVVIFEKYLDLASLGIVALTGVLCVRHWDRPSLVALVFSLGLLGIFPILYAVNLERWTRFAFFEKYRILSKIKHFLLEAHSYLEEIKKDRRQLASLLGISIFLWFVHLFQFYLIFRALHSQVSIFHIFRLVPLGILIGLIPITIAGMGTRDSALIYLFAPYEDPALMLGVGLFASLRYLVPGILGLPFLNRYLAKEPRKK